MRSRVMPGSSPTMERRLPVRRLKSVDLPTLGRPQMAKTGSRDGACAGLIREDGARGAGLEVLIDALVEAELSPVGRGVEIGGRRFDAACGGAGCLALARGEGRLLCAFRLCLASRRPCGSVTRARRRAAALPSGELHWPRGGPCCGQSVRAWLAASGTFSMAKGQLLPGAWLTVGSAAPCLL